MKAAGWLVTAALVGGLAVVGAHSHGYPYTSTSVPHGVMAEGSGGPLEHHVHAHHRHVVVVAKRSNPGPAPSIRPHLRLHVPHPYLGRLLFRRHVLPWWMRRGR